MVGHKRLLDAAEDLVSGIRPEVPAEPAEPQPAEPEPLAAPPAAATSQSSLMLLWLPDAGRRGSVIGELYALVRLVAITTTACAPFETAHEPAQHSHLRLSAKFGEGQGSPLLTRRDTKREPRWHPSASQTSASQTS